MNAGAPSADDQLAFLGKLQRLLAEGDFTATYKYALLVALAELAVEVGTDDAAPLRLSIRQIAARFIALYWRQAALYSTGRVDSVPGVLVQNLGAQAAVVGAIHAFRRDHPAVTLQAARQCPDYPRLLSAVTATVSAQPLAYLQNFGGVTDPFLYERDGPGAIRLKPGIAWCLRRFQPLVQQLARTHWIDHVRRNRRNRPILGEASDLEQFLFETPRQSLLVMAQALRRLEGPTCFYCGKATDAADVDHFIAFAQYPRDLAHNLVLAHPACNRSKSDSLAGRPYLERWLERLERHGEALAGMGQEAGIAGDAGASRSVAAWGYTAAERTGGRAWLAAGRYEPVDASYLACFA